MQQAHSDASQARVEVVDPSILTDSGRGALIDELHAVQQRVFAGVSRDAFAAYVVESDAKRSRILVLRADGRAVGYLAFHLFERELDGRRHLIVRLESGYEPAFRGRATGVTFFAREVLRTCVLDPLAPKHYLGCYVHPTAYLAMTRVAPLWPRAEQPTPPRCEALMTTLGRAFDLRPVEGGAPGTCEVGWITHERPDEAKTWVAHSNPDARFFVTRNPDYAQGHGLLVYARLSLLTLARAGLTLARRQARRWIRATPAAATVRGHGELHEGT